MELTPIRTGRKITAYTYRNVLITRNDVPGGGTLWEWTQVRYTDGAQLIQAKDKNEIVGRINKTLDSFGRDWYAKPVIYVAHDGRLIDQRLIEVC